jgi:hypothetical protein
MLDEEINETNASLKQLVEHTAPTLTSKLAIGPGHAAQPLITAGQNIERLYTPRPHSPDAAASNRSRSPLARRIACACTEAVIAKPTPRST